MLDALKNFNADRSDMDEIVSLHAHAEQMSSAYAKFGVEEPDWFTANLKALAREIKTRNAANLERMLKEAKLRVEGLKTTQERREHEQQRIAELEAKLAAA
jgi:hypothetical protein